MTSFAFGYALHYNFWSTLVLTLYVVFVDCVLTGIIVATVIWIVANKYLRKSQLDADVEWGYAFDVHLNAFFPPLMLLHFVLIILHGLVWDPSVRWQFHSYFLGNSLWLIAIAYYIYITFLGYNCKYGFWSWVVLRVNLFSIRVLEVLGSLLSYNSLVSIDYSR